jgi:pyridoxine 4-dehydrogenase
MLTGQIRSLDDIPSNDLRRLYPRFQPENFPINLQLVEALKGLAETKGCTPAQLAINWTKSLSKKSGMPTIIPIPGATTESRVIENSKECELTAGESASIDDILAKFTVVGNRYPDAIPIDG